MVRVLSNLFIRFADNYGKGDKQVAMTQIAKLIPLAMVSALMGCHPMAAVPKTGAALPALDGEVLETALRARAGDLSACLVDTDVVPGQQTGAHMVTLQLSITETGRVQSATLQKVEDPDVNECIARKTSEWMFPRGGLTVVNVELRFEAKAAEFAKLQVVPSTRTADSSKR